MMPRLADTVSARRYADTTLEHMESFAQDGLRTLVLAYRELDERLYNVYL